MKKNCRNIKVLVATLTLSVLSCLAHQTELKASEIRRYDNFDNFNWPIMYYTNPNPNYIGPAFGGAAPNFVEAYSNIDENDELKGVDSALDYIEAVLSNDNDNSDSAFKAQQLTKAQIDAKEKEIIKPLVDSIVKNYPEFEKQNVFGSYGYEEKVNKIIDDNLILFVAAIKSDLITISSKPENDDDLYCKCYADLLRYLELLETARGDGSIYVNLGEDLDWQLKQFLRVITNDYAHVFENDNISKGLEFVRTVVSLFSKQNFEQKPANYESISEFFKEAQECCRKYGEIKDKLDQFIEVKGFIYRNFAYKIVGQVVEKALLKNQAADNDFDDGAGHEVAGIQFKLTDFYKILDKIEVLREGVLKCKNEQEFRGLNGCYGAVLENVFVAYKGFMEYFSSMVETLLTPLIEFDPSDGTMPVGGALETFSTNFLKKNTKDNNQTLLDALIFNQLFAVFPRRFFGETLDKYFAEFFKYLLAKKNCDMLVYNQLTNMPTYDNRGANIAENAAGGYANTGFQYFRKLYDGAKRQILKVQRGTHLVDAERGVRGYNIGFDPLYASGYTLKNGKTCECELESAIFKIARALRSNANHVDPHAPNYEAEYVGVTLSNNFDNFVNALKVFGENCTGVGKKYDPDFIQSLKNSKEFIVMLATLPDYFDFGQTDYKAHFPWTKKLAKYIMDNFNKPDKFDCLFYRLHSDESEAKDIYNLASGGVVPGGVTLPNALNDGGGSVNMADWLNREYILKATDAENNVTSTVGDVIKEFMEGIQFFRKNISKAFRRALGELQAKNKVKTHDEDGTVQLDGQGFKSIFEKYFYNESNGQAEMKRAMENLLSVDLSNADGTLAQFKTVGFENYLNDPELYDRDFDNGRCCANNESVFPEGPAGAKLTTFFNADVSPFQYSRYFLGLGYKLKDFFTEFEQKLDSKIKVTLHKLVNRKAEKKGLPCIDSKKNVGDMLIFQAVDWVAKKHGNILNMAGLKNVFDDVKNKTVKLYSKNAAGELSSTETSVLDFYRNTGASSLKDGDDLNKAEVFETALGGNREDLERAKRSREALEAAKANRKEQQRLGEERVNSVQQCLKNAHSKIVDVAKRLYNDSVMLYNASTMDRINHDNRSYAMIEEMKKLNGGIDEMTKKVSVDESNEDKLSDKLGSLFDFDNDLIDKVMGYDGGDII